MRQEKLCTVHVFVKDVHFKKCKCLNCKNKQPGSVPQGGCRWGEGMEKSEDEIKGSCVDIPGKRPSKCPCYAKGTSCLEKCKCKGHDNSFEKKAESGKEYKKRRPKCMPSPSPLNDNAV